MNATSIERQAGDWLVRTSEGPLSQAEERAFHQWLAADVRHGHAYSGLRQAWDDIADLKHLGDLAPLEDAPLRRRWSGPLFAAAAAALVVVAAMITFALRPDRVLETQVAEIRAFNLSDGSQIVLGAKSRVQVWYDSKERRLVLKRGEAFFEVAGDASRPFLVDAGNARVRVLGTQFDVRHREKRVCVSVLDGKVEVIDRGSGAGTSNAGGQARHLAAGQRADIDLKGLTVPEESAGGTAGSANAAAWRFGRLVYENAPLAEVVADVNRYHPPGLQLADPQLGRLRITAAFRTNEIPQAIAALARGLALAVEQHPDGRLVLKPRDAGR